MKEEAIAGIVEDAFKQIDKLSRKILQSFDADDIHEFRIEVKKLRAFLRLLDVNEDFETPLIPKLLKTFYGYIGIIRNIQLQKHAVFEYITTHNKKAPEEYIQLLDAEKDYWKKDAIALMTGKNFEDVEEQILKELPGKLEKSSIKKFIKSKVADLQQRIGNLHNDESFHEVRKILKDILYNWNYIDSHQNFPQSITKETLKTLTTELGNYMDLCIEIDFFKPEYLGKLKDKNEAALLLEIQKETQQQKNILTKKLRADLGTLNTTIA